MKKHIRLSALGSFLCAIIFLGSSGLNIPGVHAVTPETAAPAEKAVITSKEPAVVTSPNTPIPTGNHPTGNTNGVVQKTAGAKKERAIQAENAGKPIAVEVKSGSSAPGVAAPAIILAPAAAKIADDAEEKTIQGLKETDGKQKKIAEDQKNPVSGMPPAPDFEVSYYSSISTADAPGEIEYQLKIKNTGNLPLSDLKIKSKIPESFSGPDGDGGQAGILDVDESWTFKGVFTVTQELIDGNGVDENNAIDNDGDIDSIITISFIENVLSKKVGAYVDVIQKPAFSVSKEASVESMNTPGTVTYKIVIENTGNISLTDINLSDPMIDSLEDPSKNNPDQKNPSGDENNPGILDVGEIWTYTGQYSVTQSIFDGSSGSTENISGEMPEKGSLRNTVTVDFAETDPPQQASATFKVSQNPRYIVTAEADAVKVDEPKTINYTVKIDNTGNVSLTGITLSSPLLEELSGPEGDAKNPGILDVDEIWTYTGSFEASQEVINANGVDANNVFDHDGDIDNTVIVDFAETDTPQTAHVAVETDLRITSDIFEKKYRYLHGFLSATQSYTTNLYKMDRDPEGSWATFVTPGIWATYPSKMKRSIEIITQNSSPGGLAIEPFNPLHFQRFQAYVLYSPQIEIYHDRNKAYQDPDLGAGVIDQGNIDRADDTISQHTGQDSLNRLTHRVDAMLHYHSGNKLAVRAFDQFKISYDQFSERAFVTDDKYKSNVFGIAGTLDPTEKLQFRLDYSKFCLDYEDDFNQDADRSDDIYSAYLFFRLTGKTSVFLEYDFADINYNASSKDSHEHRYFAGLRWEMTGKSSGQIKGGFGRKKADNSPMFDTDIKRSDISENNWMAAIQIDHNLTSRTNLTMNAYRRYDEVLDHRYDFGDFNKFYADYTLAHFAGLKFSWNVISNLHLNLDTSLFYDKFINSYLVDREGVFTDREDWEFAISPSATIQLFDHFSINGAYIYTDHDSNYPTHDYIDHTFFVRASLFM